MNIIAIIPAKGNSLRVPNKNILDINGQPMLSWAIKACNDSKYDITPWVSSESDEVLEVAKEYGAKIYKRSDNLSLPDVPKQEVIRDAAKYIQDNFEFPDIFISLQANSPQILGRHLDEGLDLLLKSKKGEELYEVFSTDSEHFQNAIYRMFRSHYVFQRDLSTHCGTCVCDITDINNMKDLEEVRKNMITNHWEEALYKGKGETLEGNYLTDELKLINTQNMFDYVDSKMAIGGKVLELGCNLSRNLREANSRYGCNVVGFDINQECLDKSKEYFQDSGDFFKRDLLNAESLKEFRYPDNFFSLGISMGFLMHIAPNKNKSELIKEFIRICEHVCIFEMYEEGKEPIFTENKWCVSFEDYRQYDSGLELTEVYGCKTKKKKDKRLVLFYK